jgi:putative FmdB family regulatory protein
MPIYTYVCKNCKFEFDIEQKITAEPLFRCQKCGTGELKKKLYPVGIAFKGPGFYSTDYKS